ncbi:MAG: hypothetical protein SFX74_11710 [Fimbriimonadaceae bacterium]|nr:hypothetical protein [Fimbriimonadaceae bacterium]
MFRRLYWVSETVLSDGTSRVLGIYTSIPDLIRNGLRHGADERLRLNLVKLDSGHPPFGVWNSPDFDDMEAALEQYVATDEMSKEHVVDLVNAVRASA